MAHQETQSPVLAAIMFTDVVGHARLLAEDAQRALAVLHELHRVLPPLIAQWHGTLHKEVGDGTISSFVSAVDAVNCACAIQRTLREETGIELRIGLHVGELMVEGSEVHGEGVAVAARIEPLAPPGGLALTETVPAQLRGKLELALRSIGHPLQKSGVAVEVFVCDLGAATAPEDEAASEIDSLRRRLLGNRLLQWLLGYIALAFALLQGIVLLADLYGAPPLLARIAATVLAWGLPMAVVVAWFHGKPGRQPPVRAELAMLAALAALALLTVVLQIASSPPSSAPLANAPSPARAAKLAPNSLVVLPFENQGGRAEDAYLSEGFGDELRDQLSRVRGLSVVARGSSIAFRDSALDTQAIAAHLGVANVIEGSLRKQGEQLRVAVRLVDGASGIQRWSESYDRSSTSLLAVQQEIALAAARAILPQLSAEDIPKPQWQASVNELMLLARNVQQTAVRPADQQRAIELYQQVLAQDPDSALAHARLGRALLLHGGDPAAAEQHLRRSLQLDPDLGEGYANLGFMLWSQFRKGSGELFRRAIELSPNDVNVLQLYAQFIGFQQPREGEMLRCLLRARELDPMSLISNADLAGYYATGGHMQQLAATTALIEQRFQTATARHALGRIAESAGQLDEAIAWALEALRLEPGRADVTRDLAERYARLGMRREAERLQPDPSLRALFWARDYDAILQRMSGQDPDEADADAMGYLAFALQARGREREAVGVLQGMGLPDIALDDELRRWAAMHHLTTLLGSLVAIGEVQEARRIAIAFDSVLGRITAGERGWVIPFWGACAQATLGRRAQALALIEQSAHAPNLAWSPWLRDSACFRDLTSDGRYQAALQELDARHVELRRRLPETLARHGLAGAAP